MPNNEQEQYLIDQFLNHRLSEEERKLFEAKLQDENFAKEVDLQKDLLVAFEDVGRTELKADLQKIEKKFLSSSEGKRFRFPIWSVAAAVIVLLGIVFWLWKPVPNSSELFAQYYKPYPNIVAPIEKGNATVDDFQKAFQTYEAKDYQSAIQLFSDLENTSDTTTFYQGLSFLSLEKTDEAISFLEKIDKDSNAFYIPAQWYLGLIYLKNNNITESKSLLMIVAQDENSPFQIRAKELIKILK